VNQRTGMKHLRYKDASYMCYRSGKVVVYGSASSLMAREFWRALADTTVLVGPRIHIILPLFFTKSMKKWKGRKVHLPFGTVKFGDCSHPTHVEAELSPALSRLINRAGNRKKMLREAIGRIWATVDRIIADLFTAIVTKLSMYSSSGESPREGVGNLRVTGQPNG
jgi:hypothetical protein